MEEMQPEEDSRDAEKNKGQEFPGVPDLAMNMQAMSTADPRIRSVRANELHQDEEVDFSFCLLMKIACTGGTPRSISKQALQQSMAKAWRGYYGGISQNCPTRIGMIIERTRKGLPVHDFLTQPYGQWVTDEDLVPIEAICSASITNVGLHRRPNPILARLQQLFSQDPKGKGKQTEEQLPDHPTVHQEQMSYFQKIVLQDRPVQSMPFTPTPPHSGTLRISNVPEVDSSHARHIPQQPLMTESPRQSISAGIRRIQEPPTSTVSRSNTVQIDSPTPTQRVLGTSSSEMSYGSRDRVMIISGMNGTY